MNEIYKGHTITIEQDQDAESPREWDNVGAMVCWHRRYNLGDKHQFSDPQEFQEWAKENGALVLPLHLYDHSGLTMNVGGFSDPWDSGQVGYIYVLPATVKKEYGDGPDANEKALEHMKGEVETYDQFLRGDVYGYSIEGPHSDDSCFGFYGYEDCLAEAKSAIDCAIAYALKEHAKKLKAQIANRVPLEKRVQWAVA